MPETEVAEQILKRGVTAATLTQIGTHNSNLGGSWLSRRTQMFPMQCRPATRSPAHRRNETVQLTACSRLTSAKHDFRESHRGVILQQLHDAKSLLERTAFASWTVSSCIADDSSIAKKSFPTGRRAQWFCESVESPSLPKTCGVDLK
jgi:hypothetical protein